MISVLSSLGFRLSVCSTRAQGCSKSPRVRATVATALFQGDRTWLSVGKKYKVPRGKAIAFQRSELSISRDLPGIASMLVVARFFVSLKILEPIQGALSGSSGFQGVWKERFSNQGSFANVLIAPCIRCLPPTCQAQGSPRNSYPG